MEDRIGDMEATLSKSNMPSIRVKEGKEIMRLKQYFKKMTGFFFNNEAL